MDYKCWSRWGEYAAGRDVAARQGGLAFLHGGGVRICLNLSMLVPFLGSKKSINQTSPEGA
jgi:hypothetical protein